MSRHLVIAISYHGFGHIGQTAPIVQALKQQHPDLRITLRSAAPKHKLIERFGSAMHIQNKQMDVGMIQKNALNVDLEKSLQAYNHFHTNWASKVQYEADALTRLNADLLLSNISYLALAGAKAVNLPALAYCSLSWDDIFQNYFSDTIIFDRVYRQMLDAYDYAERFLAPEPSMDMPGRKNKMCIGPVAQQGTCQRNHILNQLVLPPDTHIILVSVGGMEINIPTKSWPQIKNTLFLVPDSWDTNNRGNVYKINEFSYPFIDFLQSCDVLITKPGYGSFVESACAGKRVLYLNRENWPEQSCLTKWLHSKSPCNLIERNDFCDDTFEKKLIDILKKDTPNNVPPAGINDAVKFISSSLYPKA